MKLKTQILALTALAVSVCSLLCATGARASELLPTAGTLRYGLSHSQLAKLRKSFARTQTAYVWEINGVSCARHDDCEAVGFVARVRGTSSAITQVVDVAFAEHWNGIRWSKQRVVNPGLGTELESVDCYAPNSCVAVGGYGANFAGDSSALPLVERWNGVKWQRVGISAPKAHRSQNVLLSVSCTLFGQCTALGGIESLKTGAVRDYAEQYDGVKWSRSAAPSGGIATNVSCVLPDNCFAIANDAQSIVHEVNGRWRKQKLSLPKHVQFIAFGSLSCGSVDDCVATGIAVSLVNYGKPNMQLVTHPVIEHFDGTSWQRMLLPTSMYNPYNAGTIPVSCSSAGHCVAGNSAVKRGFQTLVLVNGKWHVKLVNAISTSQLTCPDYNYCIATNILAIASTVNDTGNVFTYNASIFNGRRWRSAALPLPRFSLRYKL